MSPGVPPAPSLPGENTPPCGKDSLPALGDPGDEGMPPAGELRPEELEEDVLDDWLPERELDEELGIGMPADGTLTETDGEEPDEPPDDELELELLELELLLLEDEELLLAEGFCGMVDCCLQPEIPSPAMANVSTTGTALIVFIAIPRYIEFYGGGFCRWYCCQFRRKQR